MNAAVRHPSKATILLVDDTPANLGVMVDYLEAHDYRVLVAQDGAEGLQRAELVRPDLILLDVMMPGADGFETCRQLKSRARTRDIPVIFMTSLAETRDKITGFSVGGVDYVTKPLQVEEVMARVNTHLALRAMQTQLEAQNAQLQQEIVERRQAEARLAERTAQLLGANQELEAFSYSVSHDLRAPLRSITSFAGILGTSHVKELTAEGRQYLEKIIAAATRMSQLIEDLLRYARTGRSSIRAVPVPLQPLVQNLLSTFAERAARDRIHLEVVEPLATPMGDATLLGQVLNNLVDNAMTYRRRDSKAEVRVSSERVGDQVVLRVADNGIGVAPEFHEKIFQVFQRLHSNDEYPGTGIGLATVAKSVRLMDGRVTVDSAVGRGSTFSVHLRAAS